ncbi:hypothetical protein ACN42_g7533 [Penicillium freii]|uniref:Uncharacterized protein n=1 Tax=Penicillium freii TaxID=48697 RepID=A0A117NMP7_PENFR|nr:hypothetical protein ACN42_g7533 [Penicillium freii]
MEIPKEFLLFFFAPSCRVLSILRLAQHPQPRLQHPPFLTQSSNKTRCIYQRGCDRHRSNALISGPSTNEFRTFHHWSSSNQYLFFKA